MYNQESFRIEQETSAGHAFQAAPQIIYFSYDNGLTWTNKSRGLSAMTSIGLGGIAVFENKLALVSKENGLYFFNEFEDKWINIPAKAELLDGAPGALLIAENQVYVGTKNNGIYHSKDFGRTWHTMNNGLKSLTIRKLARFEDRLYAGTNAGLYSFDESKNKWKLEYGSEVLQVNGVAAFNGNIVIATNQGGFALFKERKQWNKIFSYGALHNISSVGNVIFAMAYNELFSSGDNGKTWTKIQAGLPAQLYTFNVVKAGDIFFAAQWDGIYRKNKESTEWEFSGSGLPNDFAFSNMQVYKNIIVVSGNKRELKEGLTTDR